MKIEADVQAELGRLPKSLDDAYSVIYQQIDNLGSHGHDIAQKTFQWLLCSKRPLESSELIAAVTSTSGVMPSSVKLSNRNILDLCLNLVVFDKSFDRFRFAHLSVAEFLEKKPQYSPTMANSAAAESCLNVLLSIPSERFNYEDIFEPLERSPQSPQPNEIRVRNWFETYTFLYWAHHCQLSKEFRTQGRLKDLLETFFSDHSSRSPLALWADSVGKGNYTGNFRDCLAGSATYLFVCGVFGFIERLLPPFFNEAAHDIGARNTGGDTCLHVAAKNGNIEITKLFLKLGCDPDLENAQGHTSWIEAIRAGHAEVVAIFLDHFPSSIVPETAVIEAARHGTDKGSVMKLLLGRNKVGRITERVLQAAVKSRNNDHADFSLQMTSLVLSHQLTQTSELCTTTTDSVLQGVEGMVPNIELLITAAVLQSAIGNKALEMLLKSVQNAPITEVVLKFACAYYNEEIVELLMDHDSELPITDDVLFYFAHSDNEDQVYLNRMEKLLERGADTMIVPLLFAAVSQSTTLPNLMQLLLSGRKSCQISREMLLDTDFMMFSRWDDGILRKLLDHCKLSGFSKPALVVALRYGSLEQVKRFIPNGTIISLDEAMLEAAAQNIDQSVLPYLYNLSPISFSFKALSSKALEYAAEGENRDIAVFLIDKGAPITEEVFLTAAESYAGADVLSFLLDNGEAHLVTDKVIMAALTNGAHGYEMVKLFFDRDISFNITEDMVLAAMTYESSFSLEDLLNLITERYKGVPIHISPRLVIAAHKVQYEAVPWDWSYLSPEWELTEDDLIKFLESEISFELESLQDYKRALPVTGRVLDKAINSWPVNARIFERLLKYAAEVFITQEMLDAVTRRWNGLEILKILHERNPGLQATAKMCEAAAGNEIQGLAILKYLVSRGSALFSTELVLKAAAGNTRNGTDIIALLLSNEAHEIHITGAVLVAAAGNIGYGRELIDMILGKKPATHIPTEALIAAARNQSRNGYSLIALLSRYSSESISSEVMEAIIENQWTFSSVKMYFLQTETFGSSPVSEEGMILAASNECVTPEFFDFLLERNPPSIISEVVLVAAAGNHNVGARLFKLLGKHYADVLLTENVLNTAAYNWKSGIDIFKHISHRISASEVTIDTLELAARHLDSNSVMLILSLNEYLSISHDVLRAAAGNITEGEPLTTLLLSRVSDLCTCYPLEDIIETAALIWKSWHGVLSVLLPQLKDFEISENVLKILARYCDEETLTLALSRNANAVVTDAILEAAVENEFIMRR